MIKQEHSDVQEQKMDAFYEEFFETKEFAWGTTFLVGIFLFLQMIFMCMPVQEVIEEKNMGLFSLLTSVWASHSYLCQYLTYTYQQKGVSIYEKLKYHPVDIKVLRRLAIKKMLRFHRKTFLVALVLQLLFSAIICNEITWCNIVYIVVTAFLVPFLLEGLTIFMTGKKW